MPLFGKGRAARLAMAGAVEHDSYENLSSKRKTITMVGVLLAMLLSALDQTIVGAALPKITRELGSPEHLTWIVTAYMLASTVTVPIYGKLSDLFGRKWFFFGGIVIFLIGSVLCGLSQDMLQLIIFRAIQGIGGGAIMGNAFAIVADLFTPRERGKWQGIMGGVFGLSTVIGPALGGFLTDHASWHWVFLVNLPLGLVALAFIAFLMPKVRSAAGDKSIDYLGAVFLTTTIAPLLLALTWGGSEYAWGSLPVLGMIAISVVSLVALLITESRVRQPIIELSLFKNRTFVVSVAATFLTAVALFGAVLYIPLFAQLVQGQSATNSGAVLTPMMMGLIFASIISGQVIARTGRYKGLALGGIATLTAGLASLATITTDTTSLGLIIRMAVTGLGLGTTMPIFNIAVQNAFDRSRVGAVTASTQLFRSVGGTVGTAVLGTVLNNSLSGRAGELAASGFARSVTGLAGSQVAAAFDAIKPLQEVKLTFASLPTVGKLQTVLSTEVSGGVTQFFAGLPGGLRDQLASPFGAYLTLGREIFTSGVVNVFTAGAVIAGLAFIITLFLPETPLRGNDEPQPGAAAEAGEELAVGLGQARAEHEPRLGR